MAAPNPRTHSWVWYNAKLQSCHTGRREMSSNADAKPKGFCRLCGTEAVLVDGHIWPKFIYKQYVSDLAKGGSFITLTGRSRRGPQTSNRQITKDMFCAKCDNETIGTLDQEASILCKRFDANQIDAQPY